MHLPRPPCAFNFLLPTVISRWVFCSHLPAFSPAKWIVPVATRVFSAKHTPNQKVFTLPSRALVHQAGWGSSHRSIFAHFCPRLLRGTLLLLACFWLYAQSLAAKAVQNPLRWCSHLSEESEQHMSNWGGGGSWFQFWGWNCRFQDVDEKIK